jgi:hypothetical protein
METASSLRLPGRVEEVPAQRVFGGESDAVQNAMNDAKALSNGLGQSREMCRLADVELQNFGRGRQPLRTALGQRKPTTKPGQQDFRAFGLSKLGDGVGDGLGRQDARDEQFFTGKQHGWAPIYHPFLVNMQSKGKAKAQRRTSPLLRVK